MGEQRKRREEIALAILCAEVKHTGMDDLARMSGRDRVLERDLMRYVFELADAFITAERET